MQWTSSALPRDTFADFSDNVRDFRQSIVPLRGTSVSVSNSFKERIDLLFIDGDHSYAGCLNDWLSWGRYLSPGAVVAFHDIGWAEGVIRVVREHVSPLSKRELKIRNMYVAWL